MIVARAGRFGKGPSVTSAGYSLWGLFSALRAPLFATAIVFAYTGASLGGLIANSEQLSTALLAFFSSYGVVVIAPICFLENFAPFNSWFPGALAILTAMASTSGNPSAAIRMFFVIWCSSLAGLIASFCFSRFVLMRGETKSVHSAHARSSVRDWVVTFLAFVHPYTGSLHAFRAGASNKPWTFSWPSMVFAHLVWCVFWGVTTYRYGPWLNQGQTFLVLLWLYLAAWLAVSAVGYYRASEER